MEDKIEFIFRLRAKGEKSKTALKSEYKSQFGSDKDFATICQKVDEHFAEYFRASMGELAPELALHYWDLYAKSYKLQDYRECRAILKDLRDLTGVAHQLAPPVEQDKKPQSSLMAIRAKKAMGE